MDLVFNDLTEADRRIHELRGEIGYIALCEVVNRNSERTIARADFNTSHLASYLRDDRPPLSRADRDALPDDDEEPDTDDADLDDGDEDAPDDGFAAPSLADLGIPDSSLPSLEQLAQAACRWVRYTAAANMGGERRREFKLRVFNPKGLRTLHACRFAVEDLDHATSSAGSVPPAIEPPPPTVPLTLPSPSDNLPEARSWQALSQGYANFVGLLQQGYAHLANLQNAALSNQDQRIQHLQHGLHALTGELTKARMGVAAADHLDRQESHQAELRAALGQQFIEQLGSVGRALTQAKFGVSPELVELGELVGKSPDLAAVLRDPRVRRLLQDEKTRKELVELLKAAAAMTPDEPAARGAPNL